MKLDSNKVQKTPLFLEHGGPNKIKEEDGKIVLKNGLETSSFSPTIILIIYMGIVINNSFAIDSIYQYFPLVVIAGLIQVLFLLPKIFQKKIVIDYEAGQIIKHNPVIAGLRIKGKKIYKLDEIDYLEVMEFKQARNSNYHIRNEYVGYQLNIVGKESKIRTNLLTKVKRKRSANMKKLKAKIMRDAGILSKKLKLDIIEHHQDKETKVYS